MNAHSEAFAKTHNKHKHTFITEILSYIKYNALQSNLTHFTTSWSKNVANTTYEFGGFYEREIGEFFLGVCSEGPLCDQLRKLVCPWRVRSI